MSLVKTYVCDLCGDTIENGSPGVTQQTTTANGSSHRDEWNHAASHFHDQCFGDLADVLDSLAAHRRDLDALPVLDATAASDVPDEMAPDLLDWKAAERPGGTQALGLRWRLYAALVMDGLLTVAEVEEADRTGRLATIKGLGPARLCEVRTAVERYRADDRQAA